MKKITSFLCAAACFAAAVVPFTANAADDDKVYGTMNIPYADFYASAEVILFIRYKALTINLLYHSNILNKIN